MPSSSLLGDCWNSLSHEAVSERTEPPNSERLERLLENLPGPDERSQRAVADRASQVLRPAGAFARLDGAAAWLAGWQRTAEPRVERPAVLVFAADHGVAAEGVSAYPAEVTAAMVDAVERGAATITAVARTIGATVHIHDLGVGTPTGNLRVEDAMSIASFDAAVQAGANAVEQAAGAGADLLVLGELGIGNTTAAAAVCGGLFGREEVSLASAASRWTGPGTGVAGEALKRKRTVVADALVRVGEVSPLEVLRRLGGRELAALAAAATAARHRSIPVVIDGFICTAALAPLHLAAPGSLDHCIAGHCSAEPGHKELLQRLDLDPLLHLDLRLGEGSGALAAVPIIKIAAAAVTDVATFQEWGLA